MTITRNGNKLIIPYALCGMCPTVTNVLGNIFRTHSIHSVTMYYHPLNYKSVSEMSTFFKMTGQLMSMLKSRLYFSKFVLLDHLVETDLLIHLWTSKITVNGTSIHDLFRRFLIRRKSMQTYIHTAIRYKTFLVIRKGK
jgi:hypothetical protein